MAIHFESTPVKVLLPAIPLALTVALATTHDTADRGDVRCGKYDHLEPSPAPEPLPVPDRCGQDGYRCAVAPA